MVIGGWQPVERDPRPVCPEWHCGHEMEHANRVLISFQRASIRASAVRDPDA